jgi:predicted esterase
MSSDAEVRTIPARTHGRYLVQVPATPGPSPLVVGFHGYGQNAERHMWSLRQIPGHERWLLVAVQALHPFYHRDQLVVASWMTRQDREMAIAENVEYVGSVLEQVRQQYSTRSPLVFTGFSQGVGMAYRAAAHYRADALIALAGDIPPDVAASTRVALPRVLIGRGTRDGSYSAAAHDGDIATLQRLGVSVESCIFEGAHEWTPQFYAAAGRVLARTTGSEVI